MQDSLAFHLPDTLKVLTFSHQWISPQLLVLLGAIVGGAIGITGQLLVQHRHVRFETRKLYLTRLLDVYTKLSEILSSGLLMSIILAESRQPFLRFYSSFANLESWTYSLSDHVGKNRFFIDEKTHSSYLLLGANLMADLQEIDDKCRADNSIDRDALTREVGRGRFSKTKGLADDVLRAADTYTRKLFFIEKENRKDSNDQTTHQQN